MIRINKMTQPELKSRRLTYYDYDRQQTRTRIFSRLEIEHANSVFDTIEDILLENDLTIHLPLLAVHFVFIKSFCSFLREC
jgi:hypothetical protein